MFKCLFFAREATGAAEIAEYRREMRHRPVMISTAAVAAQSSSKYRTKRRNRQVAYHTRSTRLESTEGASADAEPEQVKKLYCSGFELKSKT